MMQGTDLPDTFNALIYRAHVPIRLGNIFPTVSSHTETAISISEGEGTKTT